MESNLLEKVALTDVLKAPTRMREEAKEEEKSDVSSSKANLETDDFDFSDQKMDESEQLDSHLVKNKKEEEEEEEVVEFDAEESADAAIDIIEVIQQSLFMPLSAVKLIKRYGGREKINELKAAAIKKIAKETLSDEEKKFAAQYATYSSKLSEIRKDIPFQETDVLALKESTTKFCEKHGIQVNQNLAFGAGLVKVMSSRLIDIILL